MWPVWPAADEVLGKRAGPPWPSGGRSALCTTRHLERVVLHQLDGQELAPMVDDALSESCVLIGGNNTTERVADKRHRHAENRQMKRKFASTRQLNDADTHRANTQTNNTLHIRQLLLGQQLPGSIVIARHTSLAEPPVDVVYEGTHKVIRKILLQPGKDRVEAQPEEEGACRVTC